MIGENDFRVLAKIQPGRAGGGRRIRLGNGGPGRKEWCEVRLTAIVIFDSPDLLLYKIQNEL